MECNSAHFPQVPLCPRHPTLPSAATVRALPPPWPPPPSLTSNSTWNNWLHKFAQESHKSWSRQQITTHPHIWWGRFDFQFTSHNTCTWARFNLRLDNSSEILLRIKPISPAARAAPGHRPRPCRVCHTWFPEGNQMHLICVPGSSSTHMIDEMRVIS
jgi:hypothetical protein